MKRIIDFGKKIVVFTLAFSLIIAFMTEIEVQAGIAEEAFDYEMGETYSGQLDSGYKYYKFVVPEKSHVSIELSSNYSSDSVFYGNVRVYDGTSAVVIDTNDFIYSRDVVNGLWKTSQFRVLSSGTYYIEFYKLYSEYSFSINAEPQLSLSKGKITSAKSSASGQITITCNTASNAEGYRFQVSTNRKFTNKVKTIDSLSNTTTVTGLSKGKVYYVRACPYAMYSDGEYALGQNSLVKNVKVKK